MSTSSTSPILPGSISILAGTTSHGTGADIAPSGIVVHSWTTLDTTLVVHLAGEIDHFSAAPLRMMLIAAAANGFTGLVLDTSRVTFCDSGLLALLRWWPQQGRRLRLATRSPAVQHLLNAAAATARQPDPLTRYAGAVPGDGSLPTEHRTGTPRIPRRVQPGPLRAAATP